MSTDKVCFKEPDPRYEYKKYNQTYDVFSEICRLYPDSIAVQEGENFLTYKELKEQSDLYFSYLIKKGIPEKSIVAVFMQKSMSLISLIFAIFKAGCIYLPLDPTYPQKRNDYIINETSPAVIFTYSDDNQLNNSVNICGLDPIEIPDKPNAHVCLDDTAYIIYTSGTTGNPKGVQVTHGNLLSLIMDAANKFDFTQEDVWITLHSHTFDFSIWEFFGPLLKGCKLIIPVRADILDYKKLSEIITSEGVTVLNITPMAFYNLILNNSYIKAHSLNYIIFGGDTLSVPKLKSWHEENRNTKLINMYGITETTVHVTYKELTDRDFESSISNIGKPLDTMRIYLLDENLAPVDAGGIGEIYVGGEGVSKGYLHNKELTEQRFIHLPFENSIVYKSGDIARLLPNGELEYIGRNDTMVNVKGYRVELGEVETRLRKLAYIDNAAVISNQVYDSMELTAFIKTIGGPMNADTVRADLSLTLPFYMIPNRYIEVPEIPVTKNGKVSKDELKKCYNL